MALAFQRGDAIDLDIASRLKLLIEFKLMPDQTSKYLYEILRSCDIAKKKAEKEIIVQQGIIIQAEAQKQVISQMLNNDIQGLKNDMSKRMVESQGMPQPVEESAATAETVPDTGTPLPVDKKPSRRKKNAAG